MSHEGSVRLFQRLSVAWVLGFLVSGIGSAERLWLHPVSPIWMPPGPLRFVTHALCLGNGGWMMEGALIALAALAAWQLILRPRPLLMAATWFLFVNLMNRAWMASSGGQQLMANVLFWSIFLCFKRDDLRTLGIWAIRLQLLLAYFATGLHKLSGTLWIDGTAMGIVATDGAFGPAWLADFPLASRLVTWAVLVFQITFPIAVWFKKLRTLWMFAGVLFHLATALWMDIPEMGLAFLTVYPLWMRANVHESSVSVAGGAV